MPVLIKDNPGFMGFSLIVQYDSEAIRAKSVDAGGLLSNGLFDFNISPDNQGKIEIIFTNTGNIENDGELCVISFDVISTQAKDSQIDFAFKQEDTFNEDWEDVLLNTVPAALKIRLPAAAASAAAARSGDPETTVSSSAGPKPEVRDNKGSAGNTAVSEERTTGEILQVSTDSENREAEAYSVVKMLDSVLSDYNIASLSEIPEEQKEEVVSVIGSELHRIAPEKYIISDDLTAEEQISEYQQIYDSAKKITEDTSDNNGADQADGGSGNIIFIIVACAVTAISAAVIIFIIIKRKRRSAQ
ncbi:MAG: hypothetical protein K6G90_00400 [Clostridia bacterium]|nr:hypothetical protein [Clostridia bacterium]